MYAAPLGFAYRRVLEAISYGAAAKKEVPAKVRMDSRQPFEP